VTNKQNISIFSGTSRVKVSDKICIIRKDA
jgi:hypothetical protein